VTGNALPGTLEHRPGVNPARAAAEIPPGRSVAQVRGNCKFGRLTFGSLLACGILLAAGAVTAAPLEPIPPAGERSVMDSLRIYGPPATRRLMPHFRRAGVTFPPRELVFLAMKQERTLEVWARDDGPFRLIRTYPIRKASGRSGPKLREGDRQVPEGLYRVIALNPNSRYHLSLKLDFPNAFDLAHANREGRTEPGSDIFIHGKAISVGCLAMGDRAIEELFLLAAMVRAWPIRVVIAPHDPRRRQLDANGGHLPRWTAELYDRIAQAFAKFPRKGR
jgi:hypothetical protein